MFRFCSAKNVVFKLPRDIFQYYKKKDLEYERKIPDFHRSRWQVGDWTDDSDQMLLILLSLLDNGGEVLPHFY